MYITNKKSDLYINEKISQKLNGSAPPALYKQKRKIGMSSPKEVLIELGVIQDRILERGIAENRSIIEPSKCL